MFYGSVARLAGGAVFTILLLVACATDLRSRRIPNPLVLLLAAAGFVFSAGVVGPALGGMGRASLGLLVGFAIWAPFYLLRLLGAGDVKLIAAVGAWLGPQQILYASLYAALAGGVLAVVAMLLGRSTTRVLGGMAIWIGAMQRGQWIRPEPVAKARHQLPYGVALAAGALAAAWTGGQL